MPLINKDLQLFVLIDNWGVFSIGKDWGILFVIGIASRSSLVVRMFSISQLVVLAVVFVCSVCFTMGWHRNAVNLAYDAAEAGLISLADKDTVDYQTLYNASDNGYLDIVKYLKSLNK